MRLTELQAEKPTIVGFRIKTSDSEGFKNYVEVAEVTKVTRPIIVGACYSREVEAEVFLIRSLAKNGREVWRGDAGRAIPGYDRSYNDKLPAYEVEVNGFEGVMWNEIQEASYAQKVCDFRAAKAQREKKNND